MRNDGTEEGLAGGAGLGGAGREGAALDSLFVGGT